MPPATKSVTVQFVTGNARKMLQANLIAKKLGGLNVEQVVMDMLEIQAHDPLEVTIAKAEACFAKLQRPLVVCDYSWSIPVLKGFPGAYMRDVTEWLETEDFLALMRGKQDRSILLTDTVVYIDELGSTSFQKEFSGQIVQTPKGHGTASIDPIIIFDG